MFVVFVFKRGVYKPDGSFQKAHHDLMVLIGTVSFHMVSIKVLMLQNESLLIPELITGCHYICSL